MRREVIKDADAEIETVERDIKKDADPKNERPDRNQVERGHHTLPSVVGNASTGAAGRQLTTGS